MSRTRSHPQQLDVSVKLFEETVWPANQGTRSPCSLWLVRKICLANPKSDLGPRSDLGLARLIFLTSHREHGERVPWESGGQHGGRRRTSRKDPLGEDMKYVV